MKHFLLPSMIFGNFPFRATLLKYVYLHKPEMWVLIVIFKQLDEPGSLNQQALKGLHFYLVLEKNTLFFSVSSERFHVLLILA